jgi:hypothetical protein
MNPPGIARLFTKRSPDSLESQPDRHHFQLPAGHHPVELTRAKLGPHHHDTLECRYNLAIYYFYCIPYSRSSFLSRGMALRER